MKRLPYAGRALVRGKMIRIGTVIKGHGKVVAIGWVGERYYWLINNGVVSMIPAVVLEVKSDIFSSNTADGRK